MLAAFIAVTAGCVTEKPKPPSNETEVIRVEAPDRGKANELVRKSEKSIATGDYASAEQSLTQALQIDPYNGPAHNTLGIVQSKTGRKFDAGMSFQQAATFMPARAEPRYNVGILFEDAGDLNQAITWYRKAFDLAPDDPRIAGNLARAIVRKGAQADDLDRILTLVATRHDQIDWREWANKQLLPSRSDLE